MTRWIQGIIWVTGSCVLSCPLCLCMSGGGSWWVCACSVGLISITMLSGYATWSFISQLLNDGSSCNKLFSRFVTLEEETPPAYERSDFPPTSSEDSSFLEKEISFTAQVFHSHLVLPWYSYISPDDKYSLQIRSTLEDLLTGVFKNLRQHARLTVLFQHILTLYIQHYRQFYRALKKVSQKLKKRPVNCVSHKEEIQNMYKPLHNALKTNEGINLHFQRLAHLLLINYLPVEITRCNLLFICLKDLFAQNILHTTLDVFCDTRWLNETLTSALERKKYPLDTSKHNTENADEHEYGKEHEIECESEKEEKAWSYTHSLSAIREETSFEVLDTELPFDGSLKSSYGKKANGNLGRKAAFRSGVYGPPTCQVKLTENRIENTHALLKYVQLSSSLDKDPSKEETRRTVATALGDLISTTAVPLLPENMDFPSVPTKMWESPLEEEMKPVATGKKKNLFKRAIIEGMTEEEFRESVKGVSVSSSSASEKNLLSPGLSWSHIDNANQSELQRSKSLSNIPDKTADECPEDVKGNGGGANLSSSSEAIARAWSSAEETHDSKEENEAFVECTRKGKGPLRKMNSFDRNDGDIDLGVACPTGSSPGESSPKVKENSELEESHPKSTSVGIPPTTEAEKSTSSGMELPLSPTAEALKEFGWENVPPPDLSPIYEESENLASTIAKLRCLLSERQSQHSLGSQSSFGSSESEPKSAQSDPGRYNSLERPSAAAPASRFTFLHKDSSGSLASVKSNSSTESMSASTPHWHCGTASATLGTEEDLLEAAELPMDGKVFVSITIPTTEVHSESSGFQHTLYIIQYDAIYLCEISSSNGSGGSEGSVEQTRTGSAGGGSLDHKMVLQTNFVKRRFREFLTLHSALEEDTALRSSMKGIKGPNKWLNLPFSKLDSATISSRKQFLEKYLQGLIHRPAINTSTALKNFLAYGSDSSLAFVKKPLEIHVPRLDKLLARTVSGVFHSIKTALPNFDSVDAPVQVGGTVVSGVAAVQTSVASGQPASEGSSSKVSSASFEKERLQSGSSTTSFQRGDFDVQLDITAEEQVCEMEGTLLTAITSTSELNSPVERATEAQDLNYSDSSKTPSVSFLPKPVYKGSSSSSILPQGAGGEVPRNNYSTFPCSPNPLASFWNEIGVSSSRLCHLKRQESQDSFGPGDSDYEDHHPLFLALVDTLVEIIGSTDHPITRQGATILITRLWAQPITHIIQSKLDRVLSEDLFEAFFSRIRNCIANIRGQNPLKEELLEDFPDSSESKELLKTTLKDIIPRVFEYVLGSDSMAESLTLFVESLQHPSLNKDLGLHLIDLIFVHLLLPV